MCFGRMYVTSSGLAYQAYQTDQSKQVRELKQEQRIYENNNLNQHKSPKLRFQSSI